LLLSFFVVVFTTRLLGQQCFNNAEAYRWFCNTGIQQYTGKEAEHWSGLWLKVINHYFISHQELY